MTRELLPGLLWITGVKHMTLNPVSRRQPPAYCAPSWSWASITGLVFYNSNSTGAFGEWMFWPRTRLQVLNADFGLVSQSIYGPAKGGSLVGRAPVAFSLPADLEGNEERRIQ